MSRARARPITDRIVIHCSATPPKRDIGRVEIDQWHKARGWAGIGYHFVVRRDGTLEYGREVTKLGAHSKGYNARSVAICLVGGVNEASKPESNFTDKQWAALERIVAALRLVWPAADVIGHNEVARKACPSFNVQEWLAARVPLRR